MAFAYRIFPSYKLVVTSAAGLVQGPEYLGFYQGLVLRPLVELLRMKHCPERHDYGMRYLGLDLPPDVVAELQSLAFVAEAAALPLKHERADALVRSLLAELEGRWDA